MAFQQHDKRFENGVAASFANKTERCINVLEWTNKARIHIRNACGRRQSYIKQCEKANE